MPDVIAKREFVSPTYGNVSQGDRIPMKEQDILNLEPHGIVVRVINSGAGDVADGAAVEEPSPESAEGEEEAKEQPPITSRPAGRQGRTAKKAE